MRNQKGKERTEGKVTDENDGMGIEVKKQKGGM